MSSKSSNTVQALWVMIGSISAFGFAIVSSMLLSRYFDKHDYGTYKQVMYVYSSLVVVFTLGLPKAFSYFLPRVNEGQAKDLISKINLVLMVLGATMSLTLFLGADLVADILKNDDLTTPLRYFALVPFFMLPTMGLEGILATYRQTKFLAVYKVLTQIFMLFCVVVPVIFFDGTINSAIIGFTIASFFCFITALYLKYKPIRNYTKEKSPYSYRQIFNYTLPIMGASIWGIIISSSDQFFISRYFGTEVFAEFANGSIELPFVGMIIGATSVVLMPVFSKILHNNADPKKDILPLWKSVFEKSVKLIYPLVLFFWFFADVVMILLYGERYENSSSYFQIKIIIDLFRMITFGPLIFAIGSTRFYNNVFMYSAILIVIADFLSIWLFNSPYAIVIISVVATIIRILIFINFIANFLKVRFVELFPLNLIFKIVLPSILFLLAIKYLYTELLQMDYLILLILSFVSYAIIYFIWSLIAKIEYLSIIKQLVKRKKTI